MNAVMAPELQNIQKKYRGKKGSEFTVKNAGRNHGRYMKNTAFLQQEAVCRC